MDALKVKVKVKHML